MMKSLSKNFSYVTAMIILNTVIFNAVIYNLTLAS